MIFLRKKIFVLICGAFFSLFILESGIRLGGFVFVSLQESRNRIAIGQKNTYKIMCLGESTTAGQYPRPLEEILNQRNIGVKFSVIDKGLVGTNSVVMLLQLQQNLDSYKPDMVVVMAGNNDTKIVYYQDIPESAGGVFRHFRAYRLMRIIYMQIVNKLKQQEMLKYEMLHPQSDSYYSELGRLYRKQGKLPQAQEAFKKAIDLNPKNDVACAGLGWLDLEQGKLLQAQDWFKRAIELNPKNDNACVGLGWLDREQGKLLQAEELFKRAIELNPGNGLAYAELGGFYREQGKLLQAEDSFEKAIELDPKDDHPYVLLGGVYREQGKFFQAEELFKRAIELNPENNLVYGAISSLYEEKGKSELAKEYAQKSRSLKLGDYPAVTIDNYRKLKEILDKRGIKLVCVQYPLRNLEPLKKIFEKNKGVIFVDNQSIFKEAVQQSSYKEYFRDMFSGDFGHCTEKGNRLLAQNIAEVILRDVFNK